MKALDELQDSDLLDWDKGDADIVKDLAKEAVEFLLSHKWCKAVKAMRFDRGFTKVAVFHAEIEPDATADRFVWVILGDIPPAYIDATTNRNGAMALEGYVREMQRWVKAVERRKQHIEVIPALRRGSLLPVEPTPEYAQMLKGRLNFILERVLPQWRAEL